MFVPVYLLLVYLLYGVVEKSNSGGRRLFWSGSVVMVLALGYHLHPLTLGVVPSLLLYTGLEVFQDPSTDWSKSVPHLTLIASTCLAALALCWMFFPSLGFLDEFALPRRFHFQYVLYMVQSFGFGVGGIFVASWFLPGVWTSSFERYLIVMVAVPLVFMVILTDRPPQIRYVIHLLILSIPLIFKLLQKFEFSMGRLGAPGFLVLMVMVLAIGVHDYPSNAQYIYRGNMGYVHIPGIRTPHFKKSLNYLEINSRESDKILILHWKFFWHIHDYYRDRFPRSNAEFVVLNADRLSHMSPPLYPSENGYRWVLYPKIFHDFLNSRFRHRLETGCVRIKKADSWYANLYRCDR